jgi:hypothetical protein
MRSICDGNMNETWLKLDGNVMETWWKRNQFWTDTRSILDRFRPESNAYRSRIEHVSITFQSRIERVCFKKIHDVIVKISDCFQKISKAFKSFKKNTKDFGNNQKDSCSIMKGIMMESQIFWKMSQRFDIQPITPTFLYFILKLMKFHLLQKLFSKTLFTYLLKSAQCRLMGRIYHLF